MTIGGVNHTSHNPFMDNLCDKNPDVTFRIIASNPEVLCVTPLLSRRYYRLINTNAYYQKYLVIAQLMHKARFLCNSMVDKNSFFGQRAHYKVKAYFENDFSLSEARPFQHDVKSISKLWYARWDIVEETKAQKLIEQLACVFKLSSPAEECNNSEQQHDNIRFFINILSQFKLEKNEKPIAIAEAAAQSIKETSHKAIALLEIAAILPDLAKSNALTKQAITYLLQTLPTSSDNPEEFADQIAFMYKIDFLVHNYPIIEFVFGSDISEDQVLFEDPKSESVVNLCLEIAKKLPLIKYKNIITQCINSSLSYYNKMSEAEKKTKILLLMNIASVLCKIKPQQSEAYYDKIYEHACSLKHELEREFILFPLTCCMARQFPEKALKIFHEAFTKDKDIGKYQAFLVKFAREHPKQAIHNIIFDIVDPDTKAMGLCSVAAVISKISDPIFFPFYNAI